MDFWHVYYYIFDWVITCMFYYFTHVTVHATMPSSLKRCLMIILSFNQAYDRILKSDVLDISILYKLCDYLIMIVFWNIFISLTDTYLWLWIDSQEILYLQRIRMTVVWTAWDIRATLSHYVHVVWSVVSFEIIKFTTVPNMETCVTELVAQRRYLEGVRLPDHYHGAV